MNENPYKAPNATTERRSWIRPITDPGSFGGALKQGVWLGFKWTTFIVGPLAVLMLILALGVVALTYILGTQNEDNESLLKMIGGPFGFYAVSCIWGIVGGILVCTTVFAYRRVFRKQSTD